MSNEPDPQKWTDKFPFSSCFQLIDGPSYQAWVERVCPQATTLKPMCPSKIRHEGVPVGQYRFGLAKFPSHRMEHPQQGLMNSRIGRIMFMSEQFMNQETVKVRSTLGIAQGHKQSRIAFTTDVNIPALHNKAGDVVMSLAPMEVITQRRGVRTAKGRVLIGGLGMGWLTRKVCEKKSVKQVTVWEKDPDVIEFFGKAIRKDFPDKLSICHGNVYEFIEDSGGQLVQSCETVLMDIWNDFGDAKYDRKFRDLAQRHPRVWAWGFHPS